MSSKLINILVAVAAIFLVTACTEQVEVDLPFAGESLVVEASLDWERGTTGVDQSVRITKTAPYFTEGEIPVVIGAVVTVTNDTDGTVFNFVDQGDGNYTTDDFEPVMGQSYTLVIEHDGEQIVAQETMTAVSEITEVEQTTEDGFSSDDIEVTIHYTDPADEDNYYMAEFFPSHKSLPTLWVFYDEFTNGNENIFFYEDEDFEVGDTVDINLLGISESYFRYMNVIIQQSSQNLSGPFQIPPVQSRGNCVNETNPDEEVLGYFRLCEVVREKHVIR